LEGQAETICLFKKDAHKVKSQFCEWGSDIRVCEIIDDWIADTYRIHNVNIYKFCSE